VIRECLTPLETFFAAATAHDDEDEPDFAEADTEDKIYEDVRNIKDLGLRLGDVTLDRTINNIGR
jgi:hypothetical protein